MTSTMTTIQSAGQKSFGSIRAPSALTVLGQHRVHHWLSPSPRSNACNRLERRSVRRAFGDPIAPMASS